MGSLTIMVKHEKWQFFQERKSVAQFRFSSVVWGGSSQKSPMKGLISRVKSSDASMKVHRIKHGWSCCIMSVNQSFFCAEDSNNF